MKDLNNVSDGERMDLILKYTLEKRTTSTCLEINTEVLPQLTLDKTKYLIKEIKKYEKHVAVISIVESTLFLIRSSNLTRNFLEQGGFSEIEKETKKQQEQELEQKRIDFEKSQIDLVLAKKMLNEYPKTKWFARISIIIAVVLAIKEIAEIFLNKS